MLSTDVAVYVLFAVGTLSLTLYFTLLMKLKPSNEAKLSTYLEPAVKKKSFKRNRMPKSQRSATAPERTRGSGERECPHYVGYLTTLPKGSPFPDECFGCRKVIQCLRIEPSQVIESFYIQPPDEIEEPES